MVLGAISYNGAIDLVGISGLMNAEYCTKVSENILLTATETLFGGNWSSQQGNALVHTAKKLKHFLKCMFLAG